MYVLRKIEHIPGFHYDKLNMYCSLYTYGTQVANVSRSVTGDILPEAIHSGEKREGEPKAKSTRTAILVVLYRGPTARGL